MKIKEDFVTNSSSTSYIFSIKDYKPKSDEIIIRQKVDNLNPQIFSTKDEVEKYIWEYYGVGDSLEETLEDDPYVKKKYEQMIASIDRGEKLFLLEVSNEDYEAMSMVLYETGLDEKSFDEDTQKRVTIIDGERY
jgi:hypothetical protein